MNKRLMDRPDWFTQTEEAPLAPEVPVVDAHHHLWNVNGHRYLAEEFLAEFQHGHDVRATVYLECHSGWLTEGPEHMKPVGETLFAVDQARSSESAQSGCRKICALNAGIVSFADLSLGNAVSEVLDAHIDAGAGRFRGLRHAAAWDPSPDVHNSHTNPPQGLMEQAAFRQGLRQAAARGLSVDIYHYYPQIGELVDLARAIPEATIVCNHLGGLIGVGPYSGRRAEYFEPWKRTIEQLAECENVCMKVGGLAMRSCGLNWHKKSKPMSSQDYLDINGDWMRAAIDSFGPQRCMFESNFPMDKVSISHTNLWNAFKLVAAEYSDSERNALCHGTAGRVYRLKL